MRELIACELSALKKENWLDAYFAFFRRWIKKN